MTLPADPTPAEPTPTADALRALPEPLRAALRSAGFSEASVDGVGVPDRPASAAEERAAAAAGAVYLQPQVALVGLRAPELRRWTNSMFTNNTRKLQPGQGNRHCMTDDRGRLQAVLDLYFNSDTDVVLALEGIGVEGFEAAKRMQILLDDVEVEPLDALLFSLVGPAAAAALEALGLPVPAAPHAHAEAQGVRVCRKARSALPGFDLMVPTAAAADWWARLQGAGLRAIGWTAAEALRIDAGRARWPVDGGEKSLVHELSINEETTAYDKGCYVGQEVLNRIDVKGQVQKRVLRVTLDDPADSGSPLFLAGEPIGELRSTSAAGAPHVALALLRRAAWAEGARLAVGAADSGRFATVG